MRRQIFRQMKQKAEWILDVFTSIFVKYESLFRIWRMQIASSDFLRDEGKNGENPLWIFEYFPEISRKICTQDACGKIRNRLWREICKQMACKVARRSLCGIASSFFRYTIHMDWKIPQFPLIGFICFWPAIPCCRSFFIRMLKKRQKNEKDTSKWSVFFLARKEGFEPSRRFPDLLP